MNKSIALAAAMSLALSGCTTLRVHNFAAEDTASRQGIAYFLPFSQFETKLSWTASCDAKKNYEISLTPKVEMTPKTGPDPDGLYVIDYESLNAFTKTSSVKVDFYENGAIKSINAAADDKTGDLLKTTLTAVGKFARVAAIGSAGTTFTPPIICTTALQDAIKAVEKAKSGEKDSAGTVIVEGVDQKTDNLKAATNRLEAYSAIIVKAGASITDAQKTEHFARISAVSAAQIELDNATKALAEAQKKITYTKTISFPERSSLSESDPGEMIDTAVLLKWIEKDPKQLCPDNSEECIAGVKAFDFKAQANEMALKNSLWLKLAANSDYANRFTGGDTGSAEAGVRYRISVPATLSVCSEMKCSELEALLKEVQEAAGGGEPVLPEATVVKSFPVQMMNGGTTFFLPFESAMFTNATLSATFAQNGVLTSAGYEQKRAPSEAVAGIAETLLGEIGSTIEKSREDDKTELEQIKEQVELAKAQKALDDAEAALVEKEIDPNDAAIAALATDTALRAAEVANINAAIAKLEANKRLAEAQKP